MWALAVAVFGPTPLLREGRPGRLMLVYRAGGLVRSRKLHPVEVLARDATGATAAQFVAFHVHPGTGRPYRWLAEDPHQTAVSDLPEITQAQVDDFLAAAERLLAAAGKAGAHAATGHYQWTTDPKSGLVVDGREHFLAHLVFVQAQLALGRCRRCKGRSASGRRRRWSAGWPPPPGASSASAPTSSARTATAPGAARTPSPRRAARSASTPGSAT